MSNNIEQNQEQQINQMRDQLNDPFNQLYDDLSELDEFDDSKPYINNQDELDRLACIDDISERYENTYIYSRELIDKYSSLSLPLRTYKLDIDQKRKLIVKFSVGMGIYNNIRVNNICVVNSLIAIKSIIDDIRFILIDSQNKLIRNHLKKNNKNDMNMIRGFNEISFIIDLLQGYSYQSYNLNLELNDKIFNFKMMIYKNTSLDQLRKIDEILVSSGDKLLDIYYGVTYRFSGSICYHINRLITYIFDCIINTESDIIQLTELHNILFESKRLWQSIVDKIDENLDESFINLLDLLYDIVEKQHILYQSKLYDYVKFKSTLEFTDTVIDSLDECMLIIGEHFPELIDEYMQIYSGSSQVVVNMIDDGLNIYDFSIIIKTKNNENYNSLINDHTST